MGFRVRSPHVRYGPDAVEAEHWHRRTLVKGGSLEPIEERMTFRTETKLPRLGAMIVGLGGNNGTTLVAGVLANRLGLEWETKEGRQTANYFGSLTQASTIRLGQSESGEAVHGSLSALVPLVHPNDLVLGGWDISGLNLGEAMRRAAVLDVQLQTQLRPHMEAMKPLPSIYDPDFIAANQAERADNVLKGTRAEQVTEVRRHIREFKAANDLDKVIVLWSANTERFCDVRPGLNTTKSELLASLSANEAELAPSTLFGVAAVQEGCAFINGSPQNSLVPGLIELAEEAGVFLAGDDFKSGQTKMKSVLVDFLVSSGIKPVSIVSYNHLGNNDGRNLSAPKQFRSKEISKSNVVDDMVAANNILYAPGEKPDHVVVIKYVPAVGDSKRALDEYVSRIFLNGTNTIAMHNTCEDSLLAAPLMLDLILLCEVAQRMKLRREAANGTWESFHPVLSLLSFCLKAPAVPHGAPIVNALFPQREAIANLFRAAVGLPPEDYLRLEHRLPSMLHQAEETTKHCETTKAKLNGTQTILEERQKIAQPQGA